MAENDLCELCGERPGDYHVGGPVRCICTKCQGILDKYFEKKEAHHGTMTARDLKSEFEILSDVFDDLDAPMKIYCSIVEVRSRLWEKYRINKSGFQEMLQRLYDINSPYRAAISLAGGPSIAYTKKNFVELDGRKYLLIQVETEQHASFMVGHR